jgi:UDP-N-acetylmuramoylalanine--D-glutamate ligase
LKYKERIAVLVLPADVQFAEEMCIIGGMDFRDKKVTVMGLGRFGGGIGAVRWLARQGAKVTVTDQADESTLTDSLDELQSVPVVKYRLGGHVEEDFSNADLVVVNPAVRPGNPFLKIAREAGIPLRCELELFLSNCPAKILGVTGSNGKSTTAAMIAAILRRTGFQPVEKGPGIRQVGNLSHKTWLGGNIGGSLLKNLEEMRPADWVVLEISSFQLYYFSSEVKMPHIAVIVGCTPNHLDWHGSFAEYAAAKRKLLLGQTSNDWAVLNTTDAETAGWERSVQGCAIPLYSPQKLAQVKLAVPGKFNRLNASLAAAAAEAAGCSEEEIATGLEQFHGLPQRCEWIAEIDGRRYCNDSAATTPESTIAALESFDVPVWLIAGGHNKGFEFSSLADAIGRYARGAAFFGTCREELEKAVATRHPDCPCSSHETLQEAFAWCQAKSKSGEAILLSPACASTDQFLNFRERGELFNKLVQRRI